MICWQTCQPIGRVAMACRALPKPEGFFLVQHGQNAPKWKQLQSPTVFPRKCGNKWHEHLENRSSNQTPDSGCWGGVREISNCAYGFICMILHKADTHKSRTIQLQSHSYMVNPSIYFMPFCVLKARCRIAPVFFADFDNWPRWCLWFDCVSCIFFL